MFKQLFAQGQNLPWPEAEIIITVIKTIDQSIKSSQKKFKNE